MTSKTNSLNPITGIESQLMQFSGQIGYLDPFPDFKINPLTSD